MKVLVLTGSPHSNGTTALLADEFCEGAQQNQATRSFVFWRRIVKYFKLSAYLI